MSKKKIMDMVVLAASVLLAVVNRLTHKSYLVNMNGNSFRLKETKAWMQN